MTLGYFAGGDVVEFGSASRRFAFRLTSAVVRSMLVDGSIGTYVLLRYNVPVYVGRSDHCLRQRLTKHNHAKIATHVTWEITETVVQAFHLEAYLYHHYRGQLINKIHPAAPVGSQQQCPFCEKCTRRALARALPWLVQKSD